MRAPSKLRVRNSRRSTSGSVILNSTSTNAAANTTVAPKRAMISGSLKPACCPSVSAKSRHSTAPAPVTNPIRSIRPRPCCASGAFRLVTTYKTRTTGAVNQNSDRQPSRVVRVPPTAGPIACPAQVAAAHAAKAGGCSARSKSAGIIASVAGRMRALPTPITARPATRPARLGAKAVARAATPKISRPSSSIFRWPYRSVRRPPASRSVPQAILKALFAHCISVRLTFNSLAMVGSATPRLENASHTSVAAVQRLIRAARRDGDDRRDRECMTRTI